MEPANDPVGNGYQDDRLDCAVTVIRAGKGAAFSLIESSARLQEKMQSNNSIHQPTEISFQINFSIDIEPILPHNHNLKTIPKKKFFFF